MTFDRLFTKAAVAICAVFTLSACATDAPLSQVDLALLDLVNPKVVDRHVVSGGQPSITDLAALKQKGFGTVISLRTEGEDPGYDEAAEAEALGLTYINIPVGVETGLDLETAQLLRSTIAQSKAPALVHCGSGNRVGALYAIGAFEIDGKSLEEALAIGRDAGLTRLEPKVREILGQ
ncbi:MAG: hypothetical protein HOH20_10270 [Rhodospirillaceae bacterium]|jgi:uncharacterized protein (TIGR01244 family)|nr:hypothetical protein [Rhodospirillaceae bacterium]MBT5239565.1 hypothetical protein [Rhodospirillaceae bacterium]MBT5564155.1 hypothetical protein [Rhodospirillaceae bacterium]MBT6089950.1 hypothetical protein [Rhodospirillaceae bacterium]